MRLVHSCQLSRNRPGHPGFFHFVPVPHGWPFLCTNVPEAPVVIVKVVILTFWPPRVFIIIIFLHPLPLLRVRVFFRIRWLPQLSFYFLAKKKTIMRETNNNARRQTTLIEYNINSINVQLACQSQRQRLGLKLDLCTDEVQGVVFQVEIPGWGVESGSGTSETCDGWVNQTEGDLTSDKVEGAAVRLIVFLLIIQREWFKSGRGHQKFSRAVYVRCHKILGTTWDWGPPSPYYP